MENKCPKMFFLDVQFVKSVADSTAILYFTAVKTVNRLHTGEYKFLWKVVEIAHPGVSLQTLYHESQPRVFMCYWTEKVNPSKTKPRSNKKQQKCFKLIIHFLPLGAFTFVHIAAKGVHSQVY